MSDNPIDYDLWLQTLRKYYPATFDPLPNDAVLRATMCERLGLNTNSRRTEKVLAQMETDGLIKRIMYCHKYYFVPLLPKLKAYLRRANASAKKTKDN